MQQATVVEQMADTGLLFSFSKSGEGGNKVSVCFGLQKAKGITRPKSLTVNLAANKQSIPAIVGDMLLLPIPAADFVSTGVAAVDAALAGGTGLRDATVSA